MTERQPAGARSPAKTIIWPISPRRRRRGLRGPSRPAPPAGEDTVGLRVLADEPPPRHSGASPAWSAVWHVGPGPDGTQGAMAGGGVVTAPEPVAALFPRPDAYVPLTAVPSGTVALA
ncbi:hypothetical protein [Streptomyces albogriseolus]|uniref:hypothetical protein n=1 Tax=Streptomyces albogriseolus TaxID=1887 RepID=UPI0037B246ED